MCLVNDSWTSRKNNDHTLKKYVQYPILWDKKGFTDKMTIPLSKISKPSMEKSKILMDSGHGQLPYAWISFSSWKEEIYLILDNELHNLPNQMEIVSSESGSEVILNKATNMIITEMPMGTTFNSPLPTKKNNFGSEGSESCLLSSL